MAKRRRKRPNKGTKAHAAWAERVDRRKTLAEWAAGVQRRDGHACVVCGVKSKVKTRGGKPVLGKKSGRPVVTRMNAHHLIPKEQFPELSRRKINGVTLCPTHHKYGPYSAHRNGIWFTLWLRANRPVQFAWAKANLGSER